jgi:signal peptidase I
MSLADTFRRARRGPWRVEVAEASMAPAVLPGDWLLVDPTIGRWPRRGSLVIVREPGSGTLIVKRVAARGGDSVRIASGQIELGPDEAWLRGDNPGPSVDSRQYGAVPLAALVARVWLRYGPGRRIGRIRPPATDAGPESGGGS